MKYLWLLAALLATDVFAQGAPILQPQSVLYNPSASPGFGISQNALLLSSVTPGSIICGTTPTNIQSSVTISSSQLVIGGGSGNCVSGLGGTGPVIIASGVVQTPVPLNPLSTSNVIFATGLASALNGNGTSTSINNTAFGANAGSKTTTGNSNTALGTNALLQNTTGGSNTAMGASALLGANGVTGTGGNNTAVGNAALLSVQGAGSNNTGIGSNAASNLTTGNYNIAIGYDCQAPSPTSNYTWQICAGAPTSGPTPPLPVMSGIGGNSPATSSASAAGTFGTNGYTIATLPTCNSGLAGQFAYVTNAQTTPTYLGTVSTTGAATAPVFCNGTGWVYH